MQSGRDEDLDEGAEGLGTGLDYGFNTNRYGDYNISIAKACFKFMVSDTILNDDKQMSWITFNNNGEPKYVVSYTHTFDL